MKLEIWTSCLLLVSATVLNAQSHPNKDKKPITAEQFLQISDNYGEQTGACIYRDGITFVCSDEVTKSWCDSRPNSDFGAGETCP